MAELWGIFITVFLAELGDKTQLAALLFAGQSKASPWLVFAAAAGALVLSTALAVALGSAGSQYLSKVPLKLIGGIGFLLMGGWMVFQHFRA